MTSQWHHNDITWLVTSSCSLAVLLPSVSRSFLREQFTLSSCKTRLASCTLEGHTTTVKSVLRAKTWPLCSCVCIVVFPDYRAIVPYSMLSGLTSVAFSCERCWGRWSQSHRRITPALHPTHSLLHFRGEGKKGGRERMESRWWAMTLLFTVSDCNWLLENWILVVPHSRRLYRFQYPCTILTIHAGAGLGLGLEWGLGLPSKA